MPGRELGEKAIFNVARTIQSPEAREEYLQQVCGDDGELRNRVSVLLHGFEVEESFLESPADGVAATIQRLSEQSGDSIGPYKLIEQIGEGGMGVVYMAKQKAPVRRTVALKIIKPGMDTKQVVARFEAERQALALMNHPNVAKVLDAGATDSGRPYFVMELVRGIPLTDFCDQQKLDTRQRLELFVSVCQAVQHAHQKGIIHRDIKPTNILVELHDVVAVPKVIDFGVAKATTHNLSEHSVHTGFSQMIGTPLYMSPEQAELSGLDVDTRTDIYSLGVLLYELLSGTTPFDRETLKQAGYDEMRRIIREDDPAKPSDRISTLAAESLSTISDKRSCDPRRLGQTVRGELDWIVMKSLEKDRTRRYESASALAADVQNYLDDEPVVACPPTTAYRFGKFARRNKLQLVMAGVAGIAVLLGSSVLLVSNQLIAHQRNEADQQKELAEENFRKAREAVDEYLTKVSNEKLLSIPELQPLRKDLLNLALKYYQGFVAERGDDPTLQSDLAAAYVSIGKIEFKIGSKEAAGRSCEKALGIFRQLVSAAPENTDLRSKMQAAYFLLGSQQFEGGENKKARESLKIAVQLMVELQSEDKDNAVYALRLGEAYRNYGHALWFGDRSSGVEAYRRSREILERLVRDHPDDPGYKSTLASAYIQMGEKDAEAITKATDILEKLVEEHPEDEYRAELARMYAYGAGKDGDAKSAVETLQKSIAILEDVAGRNPLVLRYQFSLGMRYANLSNSHRKLGNHERAEEASRKFVRLMEQLSEKNPEISKYHDELIVHLYRAGLAYKESGNLALAAKAFLDTISTCEERVSKYPHHLSWMSSSVVRMASVELTTVLVDLDRGDEAESILRRRLAVWEEMRGTGKQQIWCLTVEMHMHYLLSQWLRDSQEKAQAEIHLQEGYRLSRRAVEIESDVDTREHLAAWHMWNLFAIRYYRGRNWKGADVDGRLGIQLATEYYYDQCHMAPLLWLGGKKDEYRAFCRALIAGLPEDSSPEQAEFDERFDSSSSTETTYVRMSTLDPTVLGERERVLQIALKAMDGAPDDTPASYRLALGRAYYRAGKYDSAVKELDEILLNPKISTLAVVYLDLAIAHHLNGEREKARARLDQATALIAETESRDVLGEEVHAITKIEIEVLRVEAEQLILDPGVSETPRQTEARVDEDAEPEAQDKE